MIDWLEELENRSQYTIRADPQEEWDGNADSYNAVAIVLGADDDNVLVIEAAMSYDSTEASVRVWALKDGRKVPLSLFELDDQVMLTTKLA
jgi:hypothetical protein